MVGQSRPAVVCSIGSTDPTGAAGVLADARVYARLGAVGTYVIAGVTAQNAARVSAVLPVPLSVVRAQLRAVFAQVRPDAVRIGLIPTAQAMRFVASQLRRLAHRTPIVLNVVLAASSGHTFVRPRDHAALRSIMAVATVVTLNAIEAERLSGVRVRDVAGARRAALMLAAICPAVLVTGAHVAGKRVVDVLATRQTVRRFAAARLHADVRGTGCMLAASLATALAQGIPLARAVVRARAFVRSSMRAARPLGSGRAQAS
jgi:hydroxymethylpyrimidine/phosphomethylpyrimidine kinase